MNLGSLGRLAASALTAVALLVGAFNASADTAARIDRDVDNALSKLLDRSGGASGLTKVAQGVLVFPKVIKGGLVIGRPFQF
jgi:lipid-binding SYLF domain-containing protein